MKKLIFYRNVPFYWAFSCRSKEDIEVYADKLNRNNKKLRQWFRGMVDMYHHCIRGQSKKHLWLCWLNSGSFYAELFLFACVNGRDIL